jgi:hypothetical protein
MMGLSGLLLHVYALHDTLTNPLQGARQDVNAILEKEYLHAKDELSAEHVFSTLPVMPDRYNIWPHAGKPYLPHVEHDVAHMIRTLC